MASSSSASVASRKATRRAAISLRRSSARRFRFSHLGNWPLLLIVRHIVVKSVVDKQQATAQGGASASASSDRRRAGRQSKRLFKISLACAGRAILERSDQRCPRLVWGR